MNRMERRRSIIRKTIVLILMTGLFFLINSHQIDSVTGVLKSEQLSIKIGAVNISVFAFIKSLIAFVVLFSIAGIFASFVEGRVKTFKKVHFSNRQLTIKISKIVIYLITFLVTLKVVGVDLGALTILGGGIGIGIGIGLQKVASNFISGMILLFEKTIQKDDLIELDSGLKGFIRQIKGRYTLIETLDNKEIMVPNEDLIAQKVTNCTYSDKTGRISVSFGVAYDSDVHLVHDLAIEAALENSFCLSDPYPKCCLTAFGDSSVNFDLYFWVDNVSSGLIFEKSEVMFSIWDKLKENGIEIPFPQRDVNFKNALKVDFSQ